VGDAVGDDRLLLDPGRPQDGCAACGGRTADGSEHGRLAAAGAKGADLVEQLAPLVVC